MTYQRGSELGEATIALSGKWKVADLSWRESSWRGLRHAVRFETLPPDKKQQLNIARDSMAFEIKAMYGPRPEPLRRAGVKIGDVVIGIDGRTDLQTETMFLAYLRLKFAPDDKIPLTLLRSGKRMNIQAPTW